MKHCNIEYTYEGKKAIETVTQIDGFEEKFYEYVLNRIESITDAGAVITKVDTIGR